MCALQLFSITHPKIWISTQFCIDILFTPVDAAVLNAPASMPVDVNVLNFPPEKGDSGIGLFIICVAFPHMFCAAAPTCITSL